MPAAGEGWDAGGEKHFRQKAQREGPAGWAGASRTWSLFRSPQGAIAGVRPQSGARRPDPAELKGTEGGGWGAGSIALCGRGRRAAPRGRGRVLPGRGEVGAGIAGEGEDPGTPGPPRCTSCRRGHGRLAEGCVGRAGLGGLVDRSLPPPRGGVLSSPHVQNAPVRFAGFNQRAGLCSCPWCRAPSVPTLCCLGRFVRALETRDRAELPASFARPAGRGTAAAVPPADTRALRPGTASGSRHTALPGAAPLRLRKERLSVETARPGGPRRGPGGAWGADGAAASRTSPWRAGRAEGLPRGSAIPAAGGARSGAAGVPRCLGCLSAQGWARR